jgi:hypothetical protein
MNESDDVTSADDKDLKYIQNIKFLIFSLGDYNWQISYTVIDVKRRKSQYLTDHSIWAVYLKYFFRKSYYCFDREFYNF